MGDRLDMIVADHAAGGVPANIALMRLLTESERPDEVTAAIVRAPAGNARTAELARLHAAHPQAWALVRSVLGEAHHDRPADSGDAVAHWAEVFDRLARAAPEAGVALYALGSPELLAAATGEVADRMAEWGLLGHDRALLDLGCGIGRLSVRLAPEMGSVIGLDVSAAMVAEARRRGADVPNATFAVSSGRDLAGIADASVDTLLAADVFPYLVAAGDDLARRHVVEAARVLKGGGALLILNYAYRDNPERDRSEVAGLFAQAGLDVERADSAGFVHWDAMVFLGRKPA